MRAPASVLGLAFFTACIFSPEDGEQLSRMDQVQLIGFVDGTMPSSMVFVYAGLVSEPTNSDDADWELIATSTPSSSTDDWAGWEWASWYVAAPLGESHWFAGDYGYVAHVKARVDSLDLFTFQDSGCVGLATTIQDLAACTTGHQVELRAPGYCEEVNPAACSAVAAPAGENAASCSTFAAIAPHANNVGACLFDAAGNRLVCAPSLCRPGAEGHSNLHEASCGVDEATGEPVLEYSGSVSCGGLLNDYDCASALGQNPLHGTLAGIGCETASSP